MSWVLMKYLKQLVIAINQMIMQNMMTMQARSPLCSLTSIYHRLSHHRLSQANLNDIVLLVFLLFEAIKVITITFLK